jgi:hypothetical protein
MLYQNKYGKKHCANGESEILLFGGFDFQNRRSLYFVGLDKLCPFFVIFFQINESPQPSSRRGTLFCRLALVLLQED